MACRLFGTKPLSKSMITSHQSHPKEQTLIKSIETNQFSLNKSWLNLSSALCRHLSKRRWVEETFLTLICSVQYIQRIMWVTKRAHDITPTMMTSSNGNIFRVTGPLCGELTGHRWILLTKASDAQFWCFLWSAFWINGWINNREPGDLRRNRAHYDAIVMTTIMCIFHGIL